MPEEIPSAGKGWCIVQYRTRRVAEGSHEQHGHHPCDENQCSADEQHEGNGQRYHDTHGKDIQKALGSTIWFAYSRLNLGKIKGVLGDTVNIRDWWGVATLLFAS